MIIYTKLFIFKQTVYNIKTFIGLVLSSNTAANLLATSTNHRYVKCIDIYPKPESEIMLAIGHANGKVTFCTFGLATVNNTLAGLELGPSKK